MPDGEPRAYTVPPGYVALEIDELGAHVIERALIQLRDCQGLTSREQVRVDSLLDTVRRMRP